MSYAQMCAETRVDHVFARTFCYFCQRLKKLMFRQLLVTFRYTRIHISLVREFFSFVITGRDGSGSFIRRYAGCERS